MNVKKSKLHCALFEVHITLGSRSEVPAFILFEYTKKVGYWELKSFADLERKKCPSADEGWIKCSLETSESEADERYLLVSFS